MNLPATARPSATDQVPTLACLAACRQPIGPPHSYSVSLILVSRPPGSLRTTSRWLGVEAGFQVSAEARCGLRMTMLTRAWLPAFTGGGRAAAAETMASRRTMPHLCQPRPSATFHIGPFPSRFSSPGRPLVLAASA